MRSPFHALPLVWLWIIASAFTSASAFERPGSFEDPSVITVVEAHWGDADATGPAKNFCDGHAYRAYLVSERFLSPPANDAEGAEFYVRWTCSGQDGFREARRARAKNRTVRLHCADPAAVAASAAEARGARELADRKGAGVEAAPRVPAAPYDGVSRVDFREHLTSDEYESVARKDLGKKCLEETRTALGAGERLESSALRPLIVRLGDLGYEDRVRYGFGSDAAVPGGTPFYHSMEPTGAHLGLVDTWTDQTVTPISRMTDILRFLRVRGSRWGKLEGTRQLGWKNFFMGAGRSETAKYGSLAVRVTLSPDAKMLKYDESAWTRAIRDLGVAYPGIRRECNLSVDGVNDALGYVMFNNFIAVLATEMDVDVLDYNQHGGGHWYQLMRPTRVVKMVNADR